MSALTSLLVRDGVVPVRKIEEALQRQVIAGGEIETVLLELDALAENVLAAYRANLLGLPPATRAEVMTVPAEVIGLVPAEVAIEHGLIPLAVDGRVLEVAVRAPLRPEQEEALGFLLGYEVQPRLAAEVRVAAALAHHYGAELSPRFARLLDRLRKLDAGALPQIGVRGALARHASDIPYKNVEPSPFDAHFEGQTQPLVPLVLEPASGEEPAREVRPRRTTSRGLGAFGRREPVASIPDDDEEVDAGPVVFPSKPEPPLPPASTWASEPPPPAAEEPPRTLPPSSLRLVRGPITLAAGERMIKRASSRDQILEIFFSFARQFFDYTAMFVVHDEVADGREASGIGASTEEVLALTIPLDRPSVFAEARRLRAPLVRRVGKTDTERAVLAALRRPGMPAALTLPISIRQRVVLLLYGDRGGEDFELGAVMELVRFASRVIESFEQLIIRKKRVGYHAGPEERRSGALKQAARSVAETAGRARPTRDQRRDSGAWGPGKRSSQPSPDVDSWASVTPDQPPGAVVLPPSETRETLQMVRAVVEKPIVAVSPHPHDAPPTRVLGVPRSAPPPPPSLDLDLAGPELAVAELAVTELVRKAREDRPALGGAADGDLEDDEDLEGEEQDDEDHADDHDDSDDEEQGDGDRDEDDDEDDLDEDGDADLDEDDDGVDVEVEIGEGDDDEDYDDLEDLEPPRFAPPERKAGTYKLRGGPIDVVRMSEGRDRARRDPRREEGDDGIAEEEIVRLRASLRPPPRGLDAETRSVIVDMGDQVSAQVEDLLRASSPATRDALIHGLLYMGEAALPALVQAFPGKLEVDRETRPVPAGRDVSVVARALIAFGERAVPYVAGLLSSGHSDVRYYAALVASELVHPDLMEAVAARIHDPDPDVRRLACALLPRLAGYRGFDEIRATTRRTARLRGKDPSRRWQALDALVALRDLEIVEKTIELLKEDDAELVDHAHRALVILTCDDHGRSHRRWRSWFEKRGAQHRIEWLIEGLLHGEETIRTLAGTELERLTQERFGFDPAAPKRERERAHRAYRRWWAAEGAKRFA